jgi:hypothetical protein
VNRDDLLRMLDLAGKEALPAEEASELAITPTLPETPASDASPTALVLDSWGRRKGEELLVSNERIKALQLSVDAVADFHAAAFEPSPLLQANCVDALRRDFLEQLLQTPDYRALHQTTMLNGPASEIAACSFAEQFARLKEKDKEKPGAEKRDFQMSTLRAVGRAVDEASKEVEELTEAVGALGMGPGAPGSNDPHAIAALYRRVRSSKTLRRICELAGRYRRVAMSRQRQKATHGLDDMVGVTLDGDLGRLLPVELAKLAVPELELDTLRRIVERQAMCRDYRGFEPVAKGPLLVVVDESGSMHGDKVHTAKALALALAWVARHQKRWIALISYSGGTGERLLALPPGRWDEVALLDWLCSFIGGGSHLDVPLRELPDYYRRLNAPRGKTFHGTGCRSCRKGQAPSSPQLPRLWLDRCATGPSYPRENEAMNELFCAVSNRLKAIFTAHAALELEAELLLLHAQRKTALLQRAAQLEQEGMSELAGELRRHTGAMDLGQHDGMPALAGPTLNGSTSEVQAVSATSSAPDATASTTRRKR